MTSSLVIVFGGRTLTVASEVFLNPLPKCPRCVNSFTARCHCQEYKASGGGCLASSLFTHCLYAIVERGNLTAKGSFGSGSPKWCCSVGLSWHVQQCLQPRRHFSSVPPMGSHSEQSCEIYKWSLNAWQVAILVCVTKPACVLKHLLKVDRLIVAWALGKSYFSGYVFSPSS